MESYYKASNPHIVKFREVIQSLVGEEVRVVPMYEWFKWSEKDYSNHPYRYSGNPLIVADIDANLVVVLPDFDWKHILWKKVSPRSYINKSVWRYGFYEGAYRFYWQLLEDGRAGINDTKKVKTFLKMMKCEVFENMAYKRDTVGNCEDCIVEKCSCIIKRGKEFPKISENLIKGNAALFGMYGVASPKIQDELGLKITTIGFPLLPIEPVKLLDMHNTWNCNIIYFESTKPGSVRLKIPFDLMVDIMFFPKKYKNIFERECKLYAIREKYDSYGKAIDIEMLLIEKKKCMTAELLEFWDYPKF